MATVRTEVAANFQTTINELPRAHAIPKMTISTLMSASVCVKSVTVQKTELQWETTLEKLRMMLTCFKNNP